MVQAVCLFQAASLSHFHGCHLHRSHVITLRSLFTSVLLVSALHNSDLGSACYDLVYAMGQQSRCSRNVCGGICSVLTHAHCSYCAYNREMLFLTSTEQSLCRACILTSLPSGPHPSSRFQDK
jgi:hypothetical protein